MFRFSRRRFVQQSAWLGALAAAPALAARGPLRTLRTYKPAVVIGSGFGGAVAALRLAEAGIETTVVERGQHWPLTGPDTFPTIATGADDDRVTWLAETNATSGLPVRRYAGLLERVLGAATDVVVPACVGGGSLVFGGVLLQPKRELFEQVLPHVDYETMDRVYYPRVLSRIGGGPIPDDVLDSPNYASHRELIASASGAGYEIIRTNVGFDWEIVREELAGKRTAAASIGEFLFGCNSGAKNSLDKNYLAEAVQTGKVEILALHNVTDIVKAAERFEIHAELLAVDGSVQAQHVLECDRLFLAAGTLNTTKLLLRAKALGTLPNVPDAVGKHWGNNGDYLVARLGVRTPIGTIQAGPPSIVAHDASAKPLAFSYSPTSNLLPLPLGLQMHMCMSIPDQLGELSYDREQNQLGVHWPLEENAASRQRYLASMNKVAAVSGGVVFGEEWLGLKPAAWHPLGGAVMGEACSERGELLGHEHLYVLDGSLLPGSAGAANPALTVAANAERIMDQLIPILRDS